MHLELILTSYLVLFIFNPSFVNSFGIIGGVLAELYPFFVYVEKGDFICGGTIVSADAVLTTAHCVYYRAAGRWAHNSEIFVVDADFTNPNWILNFKKFPCDHYRPHVLYDPHLNYGIGPYDIALIKLKENINLSHRHNAVLEPCPLNVVGKYKFGTAIGLGLTNQSPEESPDVLIEATLLITSCGMFS